MDFHGFSRFWEPRPAELLSSGAASRRVSVPSRPRLAELIPSSLGAKILQESSRILKNFKAGSDFFEEFQGWG